MSREEQIVGERLRKMDELRKEGINPYPNKFDKKNSIEEVLELKLKSKVKTAGRVVTQRDFGKIAFAKIRDSSNEIQVVFQDGETPDKIKNFFKKYVDTGDFVGVTGEIIKTKTGEISILAKDIEMLSKSILPLPSKFYGLQDKEERYRKRYLDLIMSPSVKKDFEVRAKTMSAMREFMDAKGFIEIETPLLQAVYGGAAAKPFKTHCDAFDSDVYLSIAPELYLKKALVAGFDRVYEITKKFRNEGVDKSHNPEHMTIEWYQGYASYEDGMDLVEEFMKFLTKKVFGKYVFEYQGNKIDVSKWERLSLEDAIKKYLKIDVSKIKTDKEAKDIAKKYKINPEDVTKTNLPDELMKTFRDKIIQPTFLTDYPIGLAPLAKPKKSDPSKAEIFQPFIGGMELARAYSELNDPKLQEEHFDEQEEERRKGNKEAMPTDRDFVDALKQGMPPACGVGFGIERLVMLFTNQTSIRDVILFPFMKPEKVGKEEKSAVKGTKIAVAVINKSMKLKPWEELNTIAHLNASFAARKGRELFTHDEIETKDNEKIKLNTKIAIMIKEAKNGNEILDLIKDAKELGLDVSEFTEEMIKTTDDKKIVEITKSKALKDIKYLGALVFGNKKDVENLTKKFKLHE